MKKSICFFLPLVLAIPFIASAQSLDNEYLSCNSFKAVYSGNVNPDLYKQYPSNGYFCNGVTHFTVDEEVKGAQFQLQKRSANGTFATIQTTNTDDEEMTYNALAPGIYRVRMFRRNEKIPLQPLYSASNPCGTSIGYLYSGSATSYLGPEIEIGTPTASFAINPLPAGIPPKICYTQIDNANDVLRLDGSLSFGERAYHIAVFKNDLVTGTEVAYASTGWVDGKVGLFNLKSLNMVYEPGYAYTVQLALSQLPCSGWVDLVKYFIVDSSCRTVEAEEPISIYPNPVQDVLHIDGLEAWESEKVDVTISDMLGRAVLSTTLTAPFGPVTVTDIKPGQYVVIMQSGNRSHTRKITIAD